MVNTMSEKTKALIVLTSHGELGASHKPTGYWLAELTHFYDVVNQAGFEIDIASPKGGEPPMEPRSRVMRDPINKKWMENPAFVQKFRTPSFQPRCACKPTEPFISPAAMGLCTTSLKTLASLISRALYTKAGASSPRYATGRPL